MICIHDTSYPCAFRRDFWKEKKLPVEFVDGDTEDILKAKSAHIILIDPQSSEVYLQKKGRMSRELKLLRFVDHIVLSENVYWPGAVSLAAFRKLVITHAKSLNLGARAYVTGTSPWARLAILTAFDIGYRQVRIIGEDPLEAQKIIDDFSKFCFGLSIVLQDRSQLTLQPNNGSLLINTEPLTMDPELLTVLMYLNFISRDGLIADIEFQTDEGLLCKEGQASGFKCLPGIDFRGAFDFEILLSQGLVKDAELDTYLKEWQSFLQQQPQVEKQA